MNCDTFSDLSPTLCKPDGLVTGYQPEQVEAWAFENPGYNKKAYDKGWSAYQCSLLTCADLLQLDVQRYLTGLRKTQRITLRWVEYMSSIYPGHGQEVAGFVLRMVEMELLDREWYELMPRLKQVVKTLEKRYGIVPFTDEDFAKPFPTEPLNP